MDPSCIAAWTESFFWSVASALWWVFSVTFDAVRWVMGPVEALLSTAVADPVAAVPSIVVGSMAGLFAVVWAIALPVAVCVQAWVLARAGLCLGGSGAGSRCGGFVRYSLDELHGSGAWVVMHSRSVPWAMRERARRTLCMALHPDRLMAEGAESHVVVAAQRCLQEVNVAWARLRCE